MLPRREIAERHCGFRKMATGPPLPPLPDLFSRDKPPPPAYNFSFCFPLLPLRPVYSFSQISAARRAGNRGLGDSNGEILIAINEKADYFGARACNQAS